MAEKAKASKGKDTKKAKGKGKPIVFGKKGC
jgi:hypothetical protein